MEQERRPAHGLEITVVVEKELPVGHEPQRRRYIGPQLRHGVAGDEGGDEGQDHDERHERRQQPPRPPGPELAQCRPGRGRRCQKVEQEARDEEPGHYKKDVYAQVTAGQPGGVQVVHNDGGDADPAQAVESGQAPTGATGRRRGRSPQCRHRPH